MENKIKMIQAELEKQGYQLERKTVNKNGREYQAFMFDKGTECRPVIYIENIIKISEEHNKTFDEIVKDIIKLVNDSSLQFDADKYLDRDFILGNIYISMRRPTNDESIRKNSEYEGIEMVPYIRIAGKGESYKINLNIEILKGAEITEEEAWSQAIKNTCNETSIKTMAAFSDDEASERMYILTNECGTNGAGAIINKEAIKQIKDALGAESMIAIPSSIHEWFLIPSQSDEDLMIVSQMVREVNRNEIHETEQLADRAYKVIL